MSFVFRCRSKRSSRGVKLLPVHRCRPALQRLLGCSLRGFNTTRCWHFHLTDSHNWDIPGGDVYPSSPRPPSSPASTECSGPRPPDKAEWINALVCTSWRGMSSPSLMHHFNESGRLAREANICEMGRLKRAQLLSLPTPPTLPCSESAPSSSLPLLLIALLFLLRSHLPPISLFSFLLELPLRFATSAATASI